MNLRYCSYRDWFRARVFPRFFMSFKSGSETQTGSIAISSYSFLLFWVVFGITFFPFYGTLFMIKGRLYFLVVDTGLRISYVGDKRRNGSFT
jgi:hypothetical protein